MSYYIIAIILSIGVLAFFLLWNKPIILIYLEVIFCLINKVLITQVGLPSLIKYLAELICLYLFIWAIVVNKRKNVETHAWFQITILFILGALSITSFLAHNYEIGIYLEGMLKIYRFSAFFYACIIFLDIQEAKRILNLLLLFLMLNVLASSIQYFIQGIRWDNNGGLFGIVVGGNAEMNVFLVITSVIAIVMGVNKKINIVLSAIIVSGGVYIALLSELKFFYLELAIIILFVFVLSKPSLRSILFLVGGIGVILVAINLLGHLYPLFAEFFNLNTIMDYAVNDKYGGTTGNLNRLTALPYVIENLLKTPVDKLIGIGMGNADVGTVFNNKYNFLKFDWYFDSYYAAENGILGFLFYCMFFISISITSLSFTQKDKKNKEYYLISAIVGFFSIFFMIYDASLLSLVSYVLFFILALPFIMYRDKEKLI